MICSPYPVIAGLLKYVHFDNKRKRILAALVKLWQLKTCPFGLYILCIGIENYRKLLDVYKIRPGNASK